MTLVTIKCNRTLAEEQLQGMQQWHIELINHSRSMRAIRESKVMMPPAQPDCRKGFELLKSQ